MIRNSLLLEMGIDIQIAAATCSFILLFDSSISTIMFFVHGTLPIDYAILFFLTGIFSSIFGQFVLGSIVKRFNRKSIIVFLLGTIIFLSSISMGIQGFYNYSTKLFYGLNTSFKNPCTIHN
jgi:uncharacterized membrane protein YfcA